MFLRHLDDWVEKARKLTTELEVDPLVVFRHDGRDQDGHVPSGSNEVVDVEYSYRNNTLTFVIE